MQERLDDLEAQFSFQEDTLQQLNEVIIQQRRMLDELQQKVDWLEGQVADLLADKASSPALAVDGEKPPHY
ncbi:MAG: SlyX family protein [Pseudohongiellaceae bacterium]|jgi:SlyX protein